MPADWKTQQRVESSAMICHSRCTAKTLSWQPQLRLHSSLYKSFNKLPKSTNFLINVTVVSEDYTERWERESKKKKNIPFFFFFFPNPPALMIANVKHSCIIDCSRKWADMQSVIIRVWVLWASAERMSVNRLWQVINRDWKVRRPFLKT